VDRLSGAGDDDILIAGSTRYDDDPVALRAVLAEWNRRDLGYAERVDRLQGGVGSGGQVRLDASAVADDGRRDQISSGPGLDWFFASPGDRITGRKAAEIVTPEARAGTLAIVWSAPASGAPGAPRITGFSKPALPEFAIETEDGALTALDA
jgi:hypothetical protein